MVRTDWRGREYIRIRRPAYPTYFYNGYNFRDSIQNPDSQLRKVIDILDRDTCIDRHTYYMETRVHDNGDFGAMYITDNGQLRVRSGYGASFWTALRRANIIENTNDRTDLGYTIYKRGSEFSFFLNMAKFFTKTHYEYNRHYLDTGDIPEGWTAISNSDPGYGDVHSPWTRTWQY